MENRTMAEENKEESVEKEEMKEGFFKKAFRDMHGKGTA